MHKIKNIRAKRRLNQEGFAHHLLVPLIVIVAVVAIGGYVIVNSHAATVAYFNGHCKDNTHLKVVAPPTSATLLQASDVSIKQQQATDTMQCINDSAYRGVIYTFVVNGKDGLNMEPSGANFVQAQFASYAAKGNDIELQHTDNKAFIVFNDFSSEAAGKIANELAGNNVTYFDSNCVDAAHLKAVAVPSGSTLNQVQAANVVIKQQTATSTLQCSNDHTYRGQIYTFFINGKDGLDMKADAAAYVQTQFLSLGANGGSAELQHTVNGVFAPYRDFNNAATNKVEGELVANGLHRV